MIHALFFIPVLMLAGNGPEPAPLTPIQLIMDEELVEIRDVSVWGEDAAALISGSPAVHLFTQGNVWRWGDKGNGPADLSNPVALLLTEDQVAVLNQRPNKIVLFSRNGKHLDTVPVTSGMVAVNFARKSSNWLVETSGWSASASKLFLEGSNTPIRTLVRGETIKLSPEIGPSLTITQPFHARDLWASTSKGIAVWHADNPDEVVHFNLNGNTIGAYPVPDNRFAVTDADREQWLNAQFPEGKVLFGRQDFFRDLRKEARKTLEFPQTYPAVYRLASDPREGVWVCRYSGARGQVWTWLTDSGEHEIKFGPGDYVHDFGSLRIAATSTNENGDQIIKLFQSKVLIATEH
jgi:hypothetical protein